jgi:predicted nucleotidyltransferase
MTDLAFLSVRVPDETKRLVKKIAASKGVTLQKLIGRLVDEFIEQETRAPPSLAKIIHTLRVERKRLEKNGVAHIDLFGSVVRNDAGFESDIDIALEFKRRNGLSLTRFASLKRELENILGHNVDLSDRMKLKREIKRGFDRDAVRVF